MAITRIQQLQISGSISHSDAVALGSDLTKKVSLQDDLNALRSLVKDIKGTGNWYDAATQDLADIYAAVHMSGVDAAFQGDISAVDATLSGDLSAVGGTFSGNIGAVDATLSGDLSAVDGTFSGNISAVGGTYSGNISAVDATLSGDVSAVDGTYSGNISAVGGTYSGNISAVDATLSGDVSAVDGTFSGNISAVGGTYSGNISAVDATLSGDLAAVDGTFSGNISAVGGTYSGNISAVDATLSGDLAAVDATLSGDVQAVHATFSGNMSAVDATFSGNMSAVDGTFSGDIAAASAAITGAMSAAAAYISGTIEADALKIDGDTAQRLYIVGANGELKDEANMTFDGSQLKVTGGFWATGNAQVDGDLLVKGTMTYIETENMKVKDAFVYLATGSTGTQDSGIVLSKGAGNNHDLIIGQDGGAGEVIFAKVSHNASADSPADLDGASLVAAWMNEVKLGALEGTLVGSVRLNGSDLEMKAEAGAALKLIAFGDETFSLAADGEQATFDSNFTATTIIGAINELYTSVTATDNLKGTFTKAAVNASRELSFASLGSLISADHKNVDVFLNGVLLAPGYDLESSVGSTKVTLKTDLYNQLNNDDVFTVVLRGV